MSDILAPNNSESAMNCTVQKLVGLTSTFFLLLAIQATCAIADDKADNDALNHWLDHPTYGKLNRHVAKAVGNNVSARRLATDLGTLTNLADKAALSEVKVIEMFDDAVKTAKANGLEPSGPFALQAISSSIAFRLAEEENDKDAKREKKLTGFAKAALAFEIEGIGFKSTVEEVRKKFPKAIASPLETRPKIGNLVLLVEDTELADMLAFCFLDGKLYEIRQFYTNAFVKKAGAAKFSKDLIQKFGDKNEYQEEEDRILDCRVGKMIWRFPEVERVIGMTIYGKGPFLMRVDVRDSKLVDKVLKRRAD